MSIEKKYSYLYSQIVEDENDLIGHITYSLYKTSKVKFIKEFTESNKGRVPTQEELESFHIAAKNHIPALRIQAEQLLSKFTGITLNESIADIEQKMLLEQQEILTDIIKPIIPKPSKGPWAGFWMAVIVKGAQTLVVAIILFFIIFAASAKENGLWNAITRLFPQHEINKATHSNTTKVIDSVKTKVIKSTPPD